MSGSPRRFLAGKDAISDGNFNGMTALLPPFSISQNPAKDQALAALPSVMSLTNKRPTEPLLRFNGPEQSPET